MNAISGNFTTIFLTKQGGHLRKADTTKASSGTDSSRHANTHLTSSKTNTHRDAITRQLLNIKQDLGYIAPETILADYQFKGNTQDSSVHQNHCANNGASLTTGYNDEQNTAYLFTGSAMMDCGSNIGHAANIKTVETYVKFNSFDVRNREIVSKSRAGAGVELITAIGDGGYLCLYVMGSSQRNACYRTDFLNIGQWYHVVGTQDGPGNKPLKLYIDGIERGTGFTPEQIGDAAQLRIANWNDNGWENRPFDGSLGLVTLYSQALTQEQVTARFNSGLALPESNNPSHTPSKAPSKAPSTAPTAHPSSWPSLFPSQQQSSPRQSTWPSSTPSLSLFFPTIAPSEWTHSPSAALSERPSWSTVPPTSRPSVSNKQEEHRSPTVSLSDDVTITGLIVGGVIVLGLIAAIVVICKYCMSQHRPVPQDDHRDQHRHPSAPPAEAMIVSHQSGSVEMSKL